MKVKNSYKRMLESQDKGILIAFIIAIFGIILFVAFALTLPSNGA